MKNVAITARQLEKALDNKCTFDGSSVDGFVRIEESDMYLYPDLDSFAIFPWNAGGNRVARLICDVYGQDGLPFAGDPRNVLKRVMVECQKMGYKFNVGPECEFFLFHTDEEGRPTTVSHEKAGYFDVAPLDLGESARRDMILNLEDMGFEIEASHHEVAPAQHEIDFKYADALNAADNIITFKQTVKKIAYANGLHATFMPKPIYGIAGSGMHINMSLFHDGENVFYDEKDRYGLSETAYHFIAGVMAHAPSMVAVTNPLVNSYKRLVPGHEAPIYICWSAKNRSPLIRIPDARGKGTRIELRNPDPAANPYLAFACMLAAGLAGIEEELPLQDPTEGLDLFELSRQDLRKQGVRTLPESLGEAVELFAESELMKKTLGEHIHGYLVETKRAEWNEYQGTVSEWERNRYLEVL